MWLALVCGITGLLLALFSLFAAYMAKREYPNKWSCPTCDFTVKSNSEYAINVVRMGHKH